MTDKADKVDYKDCRWLTSKVLNSSEVSQHKLRLFDGLEVNPAHKLDLLRAAKDSGDETYTFVNSILSKWVNVNGSKATFRSLYAILVDLDFVEEAEKLVQEVIQRKAFDPSHSGISQPASSGNFSKNGNAGKPDFQEIIRANLTQLCKLSDISPPFLVKCLETALLTEYNVLQIRAIDHPFERVQKFYEIVCKTDGKTFGRIVEIMEMEDTKQSQDVIDILKLGC